MRKKLLITSALAAVGCICLLAADRTNPVIVFRTTGTIITNAPADREEAHILAMREDGTISNVVNRLVADGTFCQVRGHKWEGGCGVWGCLVNHGGASMRHCTICRTSQTQRVGPWE